MDVSSSSRPQSQVASKPKKDEDGEEREFSFDISKLKLDMDIVGNSSKSTVTLGQIANNEVILPEYSRPLAPEYKGNILQELEKENRLRDISEVQE
jgi:hypothetical protein